MLEIEAKTGRVNITPIWVLVLAGLTKISALNQQLKPLDPVFLQIPPINGEV